MQFIFCPWVFLTHCFTNEHGAWKIFKKPGHTFRSGKLKWKNAPVRRDKLLKAVAQASTLNAVVISQQGHGVQRTTVVFRPGDVHQTLVHLQQPLQPYQREQKSRQKQGLPYQDQNETLSLFTGQCHSNGNGILETLGKSSVAGKTSSVIYAARTCLVVPWGTFP